MTIDSLRAAFADYERSANGAGSVHPHPGENHEFRTVCLRCGEQGYLHVSLITPGETVTIATRPAPSEDDPNVIDEPVTKENQP